MSFSLDEYLETAHWRPYVTARDLVGSHGVKLFELVQPPGDFSDPPLTDLVVTISMNAHTSHYRNGATSFSGRAQPKEWVVVARGEANKIVIDDANAFRALAIPGPLADDYLRQLSTTGDLPDLSALHAVQRSDDVPRLIQRLWQTSGLANERAGLTPLYQDSVVLTVLGELMQLAQRELPRAHGGLANWQARRCVEYIRTHYAEDIRLQELANLCQLSVFHFARSFKLTFGETPHQYLTRIRIEEASRLLLSTSLDIRDIARRVGYATPQPLIRLFRRHLNLSPRAYRNRFTST